MNRNYHDLEILRLFECSFIPQTDYTQAGFKILDLKFGDVVIKPYSFKWNVLEEEIHHFLKSLGFEDDDLFWISNNRKKFVYFATNDFERKIK